MSRDEALTEEQIKALRRVFENGRDVDPKDQLPACIQWNEVEYLGALVKLCGMALRALATTPASGGGDVVEAARLLRAAKPLAEASGHEGLQWMLDVRAWLHAHDSAAPLAAQPSSSKALSELRDLWKQVRIVAVDGKLTAKEIVERIDALLGDDRA